MCTQVVLLYVTSWNLHVMASIFLPYKLQLSPGFPIHYSAVSYVKVFEYNFEIRK